MKRSATLKHSLVIQQKNNSDNTILDILDIEKIAQETFKEYYLILHDKDINEQGEPKTPHYHLIVILNIRKRPMTLINDIARQLNIPVNMIQVQEVRELANAIQYLTHKNNPKKTQYPDILVYTNNQENYLIYSTQKTSIDIEINSYTLEKIIIQENLNAIKILHRIGLNQFQRYYKIIMLIIESYKEKQDREQLISQGQKYINAVVVANNEKFNKETNNKALEIILKNKKRKL